MRDLYQVLDVEQGAAQAEIQKAYRRKAKISHPDSGGSDEAFGELATAYAVLSNPECRERYDRTGEIEPPRPNNLDVSAIEIIAQKLGLIIHAEQDVTSLNITGLIEQAIREDIDARRASISSLRRAVMRAARLRDRVKRKTDGETNTLARVLDWHEFSTKAHITKNEEAVSSMERALEMLQDYSFTDDLSLAEAEEVCAALRDTLQTLDQLAMVLNTGHTAADAAARGSSPGAFG